MFVAIDYREKELYAKCLALIQQSGLDKMITITNENLSIGDIIIRDENGVEKTIIERKNISDLASSISDGRYKEQSLRLQSADMPNHNIIYMIEGNLEAYKPKWSRIDKTSLYSSIVTLNYYKGFSVVRTSGTSESAEYVIRYADKIRRNAKQNSYYTSDQTTVTNDVQQSYNSVVKRVKKDNINTDNIHAIWLSQLPYVSNNIAETILNKYGNIWKLRETLMTDPHCLDNITTTTTTGKSRTIGKNVVDTIRTHLLES